MVSKPQPLSTAGKVAAAKGKSVPGAPRITPAKTSGTPGLNPVTASKTAWLGDPTYQAAHNALQLQLGEYGRNLSSQANRYDAQYGEDLGRLGVQNAQGAAYNNPDAGQFSWDPGKVAKTGDSFVTKGLVAPKQAGGTYGNFNQINQLTSSGKAFTDQANDYAARGMTQSSGYVGDRNNLQQNFTNQVSDAQLARNNQLSDLTQQGHAFIGQTSDNLNQARLQALATYNAQNVSNAASRAILGNKAGG